jgi:aprataxin
MDARRRRLSEGDFDRRRAWKRRSRSPQSENDEETGVRKRRRVSDGDFAGSATWNRNLLLAMNDPRQKVESDEETVVVRDEYPKARHHYLVIAKKDIQSIKDLTREDIPLLERMLAKGHEFKEKIKAKERKARVRLGYHAVPSMRRIHMHVISQDFDSPSMKRPKHWQSFTTERFIDAVDVIREIERKGQIKIDNHYYNRILSEPLKCHVCKQIQPSIPILKRHIRKHDKNCK